jgi:hypothetical protein
MNAFWHSCNEVGKSLASGATQFRNDHCVAQAFLGCSGMGIQHDISKGERPFPGTVFQNHNRSGRDQSHHRRLLVNLGLLLSCRRLTAWS